MKVVKEIIVDDLDGSDADVIASFGWDGYDYLIDLSQGNYETFRNIMDYYVKHARPNPQYVQVAEDIVTLNGALKGQPRQSEVRAWAKRMGLEVNAKGTIKPELIELYLEFHHE